LEPKFDPNIFDPHLRALLVVVLDLVVVVVMVFAVAVKDPVAVAVEESAVEVPTVEVVATTTDAGVMAQSIAPITANSLPAPIPTAGLVAMIVPKSMRAEHVNTNYRDTKTQQP
jgi:hypothetical protein